jgi:signal transduction histidine kinase/CheY-like chemotaxis protein
MWQSLRLSEKTNPDFISSAQELNRQTTVKLILTIGSLYLLFHLGITILWPGEIGWRVWIVSPVMLITGLLAWWLLPRRYLLGQAIWLAGLFVSITLAVVIFREPRVAYLYVLLPLVAIVTIGTPAAVAAVAAEVAVAWGLAQAVKPALLVNADVLLVAAGSVIAAMLGWAASESLLMVVYWSLSSYAQARDMTEEAQRNRGQLARVLRDLDQAYYRLQRANAALVVAWRTAAEAERFKAEFATTISHELRTPLNLIVGFSEMMMTSPESYGDAVLPGPYRRDLNAVYHSAQHLLALVDDVIDLARIDAGKIALAREEVDIAALVREATNMVHDYVSAKGLDLHIRIDETLPPVHLDRLRIRQVLLNLLVNAARFTREGGITVSVAPSADEVLVKVTDTGQGIPEEDLPRIFDEFRPHDEAGESTWAWHSGSGLGLPISKRFIELHHGHMGVESMYHQGTTIWFTLPASPPAQAGATTAAGSGEEHAADRAAERGADHNVPVSPLLPRPKPGARVVRDERIIVMVSDDPGLPRFVQRHLDGYNVAGAASAVEALGMVEELKPVAVLLDNHCDPEPLLTLNVPVVSCPLPSARRTAEALGVREMLSKPVLREEMLAAVDRLGQPPRRVLIADDDPDMVRLFQRMLAPAVPPEACLEAFSGAEALELLAHAEPRPDLVLLDLVMPNVDGYEVLKRMAADPGLSSIPVFVISAQAQDGAAQQLAGDIRITRREPLQVGELTRVLGAVFDCLSSGW